MELQLLPLDKYNRNASLGAEYYKLNNYYPKWGVRLHSEGHIMDTKELEEIAVYGIISWYIETNINFDIYYNYYERLEYFINFPKEIGYYDWVKINKLSESINITTILKTTNNTKHMELLTYKIDVFKKYAMLSWGNFIIDNIGYDELISFMKLLYDYVKNNYFLSKSFYDLFLENYPEIKKVGIIYQRLKIILEKTKDNNISIENIYKLDKIVDNYQTIIYSLCMNYVNNYKNNININKIIININENLMDPFYEINNDTLEIIFLKNLSPPHKVPHKVPHEVHL